MNEQKDATPKIGDRKTYRVFAFEPVLIGDEKVWLTDYEETIEYQQTYQDITIMAGVKQTIAAEKKWVVVERKLITKAATA